MYPVVIYLIQSSAILAFFYFVYSLALSETTFYRANRYYLLMALSLSAILPLLPIPAIESSKNVVGTMMEVNNANVQTNTLEVAQQTAATANSTMNWPFILTSIYALVALLLLLRIVIQLLKLAKLNKKGNITLQNGIKYIQVKGLKAPFTFNNNIYFDKDAQDAATLEYILNHETAHAAQSHTTDLLIAAVYNCIFWINPFSILVRKAMQLNLEYLADEKASTLAHSTSDYQLTLLQFAVHSPTSGLTQHFGQSFIKNRIVMLNKKPSSAWQRWRYTLILPALALGCTLVAATTSPDHRPFQNNNPVVINSDSLTNARYPGGKSALVKVCARMIRYPRKAQENNVSGFVTVTYTVNPDGSVTDLKATKFPEGPGGEMMGEEVKRVMGSLEYSADKNSAPVHIVQNARYVLQTDDNSDDYKPTAEEQKLQPLIIIVGYGRMK
jgi:TonB family protein